MKHPKSDTQSQNHASYEALHFILACCQEEPTNADIHLILSSIQDSTFDIQDLISLSTHHGVLPTVYKTLKNISTKHPLPPTLDLSLKQVLNKFRPQYQSIARRNMLISSELLYVIKLLKRNGIEALPFKGPVLSQMAYGDITLRQYGDLDILVRKKDIYKVDKLLKEQGYKRLPELTSVQERTWIRFAHDLGFIHPVKGVHLEMHWSFLDEDCPVQVDLKHFWIDTQRIVMNSHDIPTFSKENLLIYLSIHGSKHLWERIEWIVDLDRLIRNNQIDWKKVEQQTKNTAYKKMIYLGLFLCNSLFDTPLPKSLHHTIENHPVMQSTTNFILHSWKTPQTVFKTTSTMLRLFPGIKEKALFIHKVILKPSLNEYMVVDLPQILYWVYYFIRPWILFKKYFKKFYCSTDKLN